MRLCTRVHQTAAGWKETEKAPYGKLEWREGVRMGGLHPSLVVQPCPPASSSSPEASTSLEQPFRK